MTKLHIVCDFDNTLTNTNVARDLLAEYTPHDRLVGVRERYDAGKISFRVYQEQAFDLVRVSVSELSGRAAENAAVRPLVQKVFGAVWSAGGSVAVASAGLDIYIGPVLKKAGLDRAEVHSGRVASGPAETPPFRYDYPSSANSRSTTSCRGDWVTCKCEVVRRLRHRDTESEVIFIGDGLLSDTCAVANEADTVFATDRLLDYCTENDIAVMEFSGDFGPVLEYVTSKLSVDGDR